MIHSWSARALASTLLLLAAPVLAAHGAERASGRPGASVLVQPEIRAAARPAILLGADAATGAAHIRLVGSTLVALPTIDVLCGARRRTVVLTRAARSAKGTSAIYEVPPDLVTMALNATECRLLSIGAPVPLPRDLVWQAWSTSDERRPPRLAEAQVHAVQNGDTITVQLGGRTETVRYLGIDSPDVSHPTNGIEPGSREATDLNRLLVSGKAVRLELDAVERDASGRLLAYVYVGDTMVNAEMVARGYARALNAPPHGRYQELFAKLERDARADKRGIWAAATRAELAPRPQIDPGSQNPSTLSREVAAPGVSPETAWTCPATAPIKGNFTTSSGEPCIYHVPGREFYDKTKPERCYASETDARRDGCRRSRR